MITYTIRFLNERGVVAHERSMACETDDHAIDRLAAIRHAWAMELWDGQRMVWRFDAGPFMGGRGSKHAHPGE